MGGRGGGGGGRGGRGGGAGGGGASRNFDNGPPASVVELGTFMHECEGEMVVKSTNKDVPYFNAPVYLENKSKIGKVDEIFGGRVCFLYGWHYIPPCFMSEN
jgi:H/ACA ribonucleoprotein complex subunit 1